MKREIINKVFDLREWQNEAFRNVVSAAVQGKKDFLCVATPGAGKTKFALCVAHYFLKERYCERVVVVTPSDQLKRQWSWEAAEFAGIDLDPDFSNSQGIEVSDFHGVAITYALLGQDKKSIHAQNTFNKKTFVIFDEVHHTGESLSWGNAVKDSFENAVFRLAISGTAFRSDDAQIPFITYENKVSVADYTYSYERAIRENVCRPVYFTIIKAELYFRQAVGRFVRVLKSLQSQDAFVFIPQDKDIVKLAETIQMERDHALDEADRKAGASDGLSNTDLFGNQYTPALTGKFTMLGSEAGDSKTIAVNVELSSGAKHSVDTRRAPNTNDPVYLQKERLRDSINLLAKRYAIKQTNGNRNIRPDFKALHKIWREQGGKEMHLETIEELNKRLNFYQNKLRA